ncbi:unnamed protein product [Closterium sp. NIES-53]
MVGAVVDTGVVDTLEAWLENARRLHEANEYGDLPWAVVEAGIRAMWATEHPSQPVSPRPVNTEGGVDAGVNAGGGLLSSSAGGTSRQRGVIHADQVGGVQARGVRSSMTAGSSQGNLSGRQSGLSPMSATHVTASGIVPSYGYFKFTLDMILVTPLLVGRPDILTWKEAIEPQLEMAGLIGFARGTVAMLEDPDLRADFRAVQLLTFMVISRCCSPDVQIALKSCREHLDAGHRAWHFIESTYQVTDDLFIGQLEWQLTHLWMGDQETATDYCNRAQRILATIRMAGKHTRASLNEDTLTSYILQDKAMQEAERSQELLAQVNYVAPAKQGVRSGWKLTKDTDKRKPAKDSCRGGGSWRRECWLCDDPNHISFECPDHSDFDDDNAKGGRGRSGSRRPRQGGNKPRKEKLSTKSTLAMDADSSAGGKRRDDKEASCSLIGVVEPTESIAGEEQTKEVQPTMVKSAKGAAARQQPTREHAVAKPTTEQSATGQSAGEPTSGEQSAGTPTVVQQDPEGSDDSDDGGEAEESTDNDVVEVQNGPRRTSRLRRPPDFFVPAAFTMVYDVDADDPAYDDGEDDDELPELDLDMHADPEHRWNISTMTRKEALASWKGKAVKAAHGGGDL